MLLHWLVVLVVLVGASGMPAGSNEEKKRIVCYFSSWSSYRPGEAKFDIEDIDTSLCTHLLYAYATFDDEFHLAPLTKEYDIEKDGYNRFTSLKKKNPDLKTYLSLGGSREALKKFSAMVSTKENRAKFISSVIKELKKFDFDGFDLVWKYPGTGDGSSADDKLNLAKLMKEIREAFDNEEKNSGSSSLGLSMTVPHLEHLIEKGFDIEKLSKLVDFLTIISYDYHLPKESVVNILTPLYEVPEDKNNDHLNIDASVKYYLERGVKPELLNIAIPLYGLQYVLKDVAKTSIGSLTEQKEESGEPYIIYNELCRKIKDENWTVKKENITAFGPYAYKDSQWVSYDDEEMVVNKAKYVKEKGLGGVMFWSIDEDDFKGYCNNKKYPLITAAKDELQLA